MDDLESSLGLRRSSVTPAEAQSKLDKAIIKLDQLQKQQQQQLKVGGRDSGVTYRATVDIPGTSCGNVLGSKVLKM